MHRRMPLSARPGPLAAFLLLFLTIAVALPAAAPATIVPGTPGAEVTDEQPEDTTTEIAPELPPPDLPTLNAQGWSFDLKSTLNMDLASVPTQTAVYIIRREVTTQETAETLVETLGIGAELVSAG